MPEKFSVGGQVFSTQAASQVQSNSLTVRACVRVRARVRARACARACARSSSHTFHDWKIGIAQWWKALSNNPTVFCLEGT